MSDGSPESVSQGPDRRAVRVSLTFEDFRSFITQYASHISMGGMFIGTRTPLPPGTLCKLDVRLKSGDGLIGGLGEVVWTRDRPQGPERPPGMGVRFRELEEASRDLVFAIVDRRLVEGGHVFQLDEDGEEEIPDLGELLQRAEEHRQEIEEQSAAAAVTEQEIPEVAEQGVPVMEDSFEEDDFEPDFRRTTDPPVLPPSDPEGGADAGLETMLAVGEAEGHPPPEGSEGPQEPAPPAAPAIPWQEEESDQEALPSIRPELLGGEASEAVPSPSVLPEVPDFEDPEPGPPEAPVAEMSEAGATDFDEAEFDEADFDEPSLDELTSSVTTIDELERAETRVSEGTEEVDFGDGDPQLLTELYPGLAERMESEGLSEDGPRQSTEEVLVSLEKPVPPGSPGSSFEEPEISEEPASGQGPASAEEAALEARLAAVNELIPSVEPEPKAGEPPPASRVFRAPLREQGPEELAAGAPAPPLSPPPVEGLGLPVEESWSGYSGTTSSGSRWILILIPLLAVVLGGGYYLWQRPPAPAVAGGGAGEATARDAAPSAEPLPEGGAALREAEVPAAAATASEEPPVITVSAEPDPPAPAAAAAGSVPAEPLPEVAAPMTALEGISWEEVPEGTLVTLTADGTIGTEAFSYARIGSGEPRLLVRLLGVQRDPRKGSLSVATAEVRRIRTGFHKKPAGNEVHIVLDLAGPSVEAPRIEPRGRELKIWLSSGT